MNYELKSAALAAEDIHYTRSLIRINFLCLYLSYHGRPYNPLVGVFHSFSDNGNSRGDPEKEDGGRWSTGVNTQSAARSYSLDSWEGEGAVRLISSGPEEMKKIRNRDWILYAGYHPTLTTAAVVCKSGPLLYGVPWPWLILWLLYCVYHLRAND